MANIIDNLNVLNTNLDNAKFKIAKNLKDKGVQALPSDKLDALADKIVDIPSGSCNLQELNVVENGTYTPQAGDVKGYNKVTVNVPSGGGGNEPFKFSEIGYTGAEEPMKSGLEYAKQIYDTWDASQTDLSFKFQNDKKLVYMPLVNTSNVTNMGVMFDDCSSLQFIPTLNTSKVTNMFMMFSNCKSITSIPALDTSLVTDMHNMFQDCSLLTTIPELDTSSCTNMSGMFLQCPSLTTIPVLNTSKVEQANSIVARCWGLQSILELDFKSVISMDNAFGGIADLRYINIKNLGTQSAITNIDFMGYSYNPNNLIGIDGDGITGCRQALVDTLLTNSFDRATAGYPICTIKLAPDSKAVLTAEEVTAIEAKGYTIVTQ